AAQYEKLALVYIVASRRAGRWLIPAFHAVLDEGIYDKHDDPQNFDFATFNENIEKLLQQARNPTPPKGASVPKMLLPACRSCLSLKFGVYR
ncbi:MAG TPA: hypothetical protein VEH75_06405, partial [Xanthobacteraceae bacterium]|nr:hypothetical protein [Xanthobacteraceae bacterium]